MGFGPGDIRGQASGRRVGEHRIVAGQIGTHDGPGVAPIGALEEVVSPEPDRPAVMGREDERTAPVEPEVRPRQLGGRSIVASHDLTEVEDRRGRRGDGLPALPEHRIEPLQPAALRLGVDGAPVVRVDRGVEAVPRVELEPVVGQDPGDVPAVAGATPVAIVLEATVDPVGIPVVGRDSIELPDVHVVEQLESESPVVADVRALVVADVEALAVGRVDPQGVKVAGDSLQRPAEGAPPVLGDHGLGGEDEDPLAVIRVEEDVAVVERPAVEAIDEAPMGPTVLGAIDPAAQPGHVPVLGVGRSTDAGRGLVTVLDHRHQGLRIVALNGDPDLAGRSLGQAPGELDPGLAAVGGLEEPAIGPAAGEPMRFPESLPHPGVKHLGVGGIHGEVAGPGPAVSREPPGQRPPGLPAIGGLEDAALSGMSPEVALRRDVDDVRVAGVNQHLTDVVAGPEAHVAEGLAAVGRLVDTITPAHAVPDT